MKTLARNFLRTGILMVSVPLVSCIGGGVVKEQKRSMTEFNIEKSVRVIHGGNLGKNPTGKEILSAWGEPDRKEPVKKDLVWVYNTKPAVSGLALFYFLPIPLVVPSGDNGIDFYFRNGSQTPWRAVERTTGISGGYVDVTDDVDRSSFHKFGD